MWIDASGVGFWVEQLLQLRSWHRIACGKRIDVLVLEGGTNLESKKKLLVLGHSQPVLLDFGAQLFCDTVRDKAWLQLTPDLKGGGG